MGWPVHERHSANIYLPSNLEVTKTHELLTVAIRKKTTACYKSLSDNKAVWSI
jgi:hypothetical protein